MQWALAGRPPFSLPAVVRSHGWIQLVPFVRSEDSTVMSYITQLASGRPVELCIREAPGGVLVEVNGTLPVTEQQEVTDQVTWMLGLSHDLAPFYALARQEPKLAQVEARAQGRLLRSPSLFEDTVKTILTTNTTWAGTLRMVEAVVSQYGAALPSDPARHAFPTPERLAAADERALRTLAKLGYRAPYVLELARAVASGEIDLEGYKTTDLPTPQLRKQLLALKGVGAYAAAHLLMILGRYDTIPVDSWALKIVSHEWHGGTPIGPAEVEAAFERWGEWKGLAFWFWSWSYQGT
jgi:3-methyladenine DNA glycosylase/8-oxoguanine DNA glycosylase